MPLFVVALGLSVLGSISGLLVASLLLLFRDDARIRLIPWLISYAVGTLLGAALLALLPEALEHLPASGVLRTLLLGILTFFILEKLVLWRHCHQPDGCVVHSAAASLVLIGDAFHNFVDGAIITAAVFISIPLGLSTAIAVAAHEIPQELGDFAILLNAGYSRRQALVLNLISGMAGIVGAATMYFAIEQLPRLLPYVLPFSAGGLLYVAMADLIPDLHRGTVGGSAVRQVALVGAGLATVVAL